MIRRLQRKYPDWGWSLAAVISLGLYLGLLVLVIAMLLVRHN